MTLIDAIRKEIIARMNLAISGQLKPGDEYNKGYIDGLKRAEQIIADWKETE